MRMTYTSFMQFYENDNMNMLWSIWSPWRNKKGATAAKQKWCHGNIPVPIAHGDTGAKGKVTRAWHAIEGGVIPATGFPRVDDGDKRVKHPTITGGYNIRTCIRPRVIVSAVIPSRCILGAVRVHRGSRGSSHPRRRSLYTGLRPRK